MLKHQTQSNSIIPFSDTPFSKATGLELFGMNSSTRRAVLEHLQDNHDKYDIYFNDLGYHNHTAHYLLAAYSCGASADRLKEIANSLPRRPKLPLKLKLTQDNWTQHLGDLSSYNDYLVFFEKEIEEKGVQATYEKYTFHPDMLARLYDGAFHPIIHIGWGVEFQLPMIVAEGLALTAAHGNAMKDLIDEEFFSFKGTEKKSILSIVQDIQNDTRFDNVINYHDDEAHFKLERALQKLGDIIKEHAKCWVVTETEEGVQQAVQEWYEAVALIFGATAIRPDKTRLEADFFLMHAFTSVPLIYNQLPYIDLQKRIMLIRGHLAATLTEYVARGRPSLNIETLKNFTPKELQDGANPWLDVLKYALLEDREPHMIKVVRGLMLADQKWGNGKDNLYVKIAQLTVEAFREFGYEDDIGYEESWEHTGRNMKYNFGAYLDSENNTV